ncbi:hypothetical protein BJV82DRAFT_297080 [Fennellomyces sp. T-0311]|nr:hypothetical protein BJV82DRAFT_297080 [Fennellomyces sp. T-0311]
MNAFSSKKSFTLESFYQLLRGRIFYGNVDYAQWLMHCIANATLPIPPVFALAAKEFVYSVFLVDRIEKIPEQELLPYFENTNEITIAQVLIAMYILTFHDAIIAFKTDQKLVLTSHQEQQEYSASFVDRIPIRIILKHIEQERGYRGIYKNFIALAANLYPELFDVTSLLLQEGKQDFIVSHRYRKKASHAADN